MGYYTYFSLYVENDDKIKRQIAEDLYRIIWDEKCDLYSKDEYQDIDYNDDIFCEDLKWYDWYDDMIDISKKYPNCLFHLEGFGEDHDDWWEAHFKNGHGYQQMAIIPPFDPSKLRMEDTCLGIDEVI